MLKRILHVLSGVLEVKNNMKLLIITQILDKNDPVLGFFHRWVEEFAKKCEVVTVICLKKGDYFLPKNVRVFSLGKEEGVGRLMYAWRFYYFIWHERKWYDSVFVHMNHIYTILGAPFWRVLRKRVGLWYNHGRGSWSTRLGACFSRRVFYTSPFSFFAKHRKAVRMGVGVVLEQDAVQKEVKRKKNTVLFLGRVAPVKKIEVMLEALALLPSDIQIHLYGPVSEKDASYAEALHARAKEKDIQGRALFFPAVLPNNTAEVYAQYDCFLNLTPDGGFDKTIFEAMVQGAIPVVSNPAFLDILPKELIVEGTTPKNVAHTLAYSLSLSEMEKSILRETLRAYVVSRHGLTKLVSSVCDELKK